MEKKAAEERKDEMKERRERCAMKAAQEVEHKRDLTAERQRRHREQVKKAEIESGIRSPGGTKVRLLH